MPRRSVVSRRLTEADGTITVRVDKQILEGGQVILATPHIIAFPPGSDAAHIMAENDAHLTRDGFGAVVDWEGVKRMIASEHTEEVVSTYRAARALAMQPPAPPAP